MKCKLFRILAVALVMLLTVLQGAPAVEQVQAAKKVKIKKIKVTNVKKKKLTLKKGKTFKLKVKVKTNKKKVKYKKVRFVSSNKKIVKVNKKGKITAKKVGKAKVSVISKVNKKKKVVIRVTVVKNKKEEKNATPTPQETTKPTIAPTETPVVTNAPTPSPTPIPTPTPTPDGTSTLSRKPFAEAAYAGDTLSQVEIKGGSILDSNGNEIAGSYSWETPDETIEKGRARYEVIFTPEDSSFQTVENISLLVHVFRNPLTLTVPSATGVATGKKLSGAVLKGGSAKDGAGNTVEGSYQWTNPELVVTQKGYQGFSVTFMPTDTDLYRPQTVTIYATASGNNVATEEDKLLDISSGTWKNTEAYGRAWSGNSYCINSYLGSADMSKYSDITIKTKQYDNNGTEITANKGNIMYKLATSDWGSQFSQAWGTDTGKLSLENYSGGDLYLIVQNVTADIGYIEITSITLNRVGASNITDGSSLKAAFENTFDKVGMAIESYQINNKNVLEFAKSQANSLTMGNEMKPDYILGRSATLHNSNPEGYVDTSEFTYEYKDTKYPEIALDSIGNYVKTAYDNGMKMRYHVFIWHTQTPSWFFKEGFSGSGDYVSADVMDGRMEYLIRNVMTYVYNLQNEEGIYIGREVVDSWDIANEYFHNYDKGYKSYWDCVYYPEYEFTKNKHSGILTPTYIKKAFAIGYSILQDYQLEDKVKLISNDFNTYMETDKIITMINYFNTKDEINPAGEWICHGVGMQMHLDLGYPSIQGVKTTLEKFRDAGLEIEITELDMTDYSQTEDSQFNQRIKWYDLMYMILGVKDSGAKITGITWWGPSDLTSWRADGVPLLFSDYWQAKEHYTSVLDAVTEYNQGF